MQIAPINNYTYSYQNNNFSKNQTNSCLFFRNTCYNYHVKNMKDVIMFTGKYDKLSSTLKEFVKDFDIDNRALSAYKKCLENMHKQEHPDYQLLNKLIPIRQKTAFELKNIDNVPNKETVSQKILLTDTEDSVLGYYKVFFDMAGEIVDDILTLF